MRLNEVYRRYRRTVDFYCVYIQEAHPEDGWQVMSNIDDGVVYSQPTDADGREALAQVCAVRLELAMPMLIDDMANTVDTLYAALPERLYLLDEQGVVRHRSVVGSPGFDVDAWEAAISDHIKLG
ncbi:MAG: hypothetical protein HOI95_10690 [Chromatiales bacterium]|nr:hypothetical protein [Chromatiales bacterium]